MEGIRNVNSNFQQPNHYIQNRYNAYSYAPKQQQKEPQSKGNPLLSAGILQGIAILLTKVSEWCGKKLMQGKEFTNADNVKVIADKMLSENNLQTKVAVEYIDKANAASVAAKYRSKGVDILGNLGPVARGENAFYTDTLKLAVAPKSKPSLILHELGHAITAHKGKFMKFLQNSRTAAAAIPTVLLMLDNASAKPNGEKSFFEKHAVKIGFCAFLPTIIEEGIASLRGINAVKQVKQTLDNTINLKPLKRNYAFAWLTYVIAGIGLGVAAKQSIIENKTG